MEIPLGAPGLVERQWINLFAFHLVVFANYTIMGLMRINVQVCVRFGALEEVFMSYKPHGAWRTMEM
jgi:hypothetical protein